MKDAQKRQQILTVMKLNSFPCSLFTSFFFILLFLFWKTLKTAFVTHSQGIWDLLFHLKKDHWDFIRLHFFVRSSGAWPLIYLWDVPGLQRAARGQQLPIAGQTKQLISSSPVSFGLWRLFRMEMNANMSAGSTARSSRVSSWHHATFSHLSERSKHPGGHVCRGPTRKRDLLLWLHFSFIQIYLEFFSHYITILIVSVTWG